MLDVSIGGRGYRFVVLASCFLVAASPALTWAVDESLKGETAKVDDLKGTQLKLPGKATLPCMLWADPEGSAFFALEGETGLLRRISFPDCKVTKQKKLDQKFNWMSISQAGLILSADSDRIWVVDPATLEVKSKIDVPKLKRAVSTLNSYLAVACDRGQPTQDQKLYIVDLMKKSAEAWVPPNDLMNGAGNWKCGLDIPAMSPDGAYVFTQGDCVNVHMCRFSFKQGKLTFEGAEEQVGDQRYDTGGNRPDNTAGIMISPDSKYVCQVFPGGHETKTPIYAITSFDKQHCVLDHGKEKLYPGYRALERPLAMAFDPKGGYIYAQNQGQEFMLSSYSGAKIKEYKVGFGAVRQFLVHPGGNHVILLREAAIDAGMGRIIHSDPVLIEVPKKPAADK